MGKFPRIIPGRKRRYPQIGGRHAAEPLGTRVVGQTQFTSKIKNMKSSTHDKAAGTAKDLKGKVKEAAGRATRNPDLENEGTADRVEGKVQKKVGDVKKVFGK